MALAPASSTPTALPPSGAAGGVLGGNYPDPSMAAGAATANVGALGGDTSGTLPNPTVAKINGVAVTGTPSVGDVPTATSASAATWQPSGGSSPVTVEDFLFTEEATAGVYIATFDLPARSFLIDVGFWIEADFAADTAALAFEDVGGQIGGDEDVKTGTPLAYNSKATIEGPIGALVVPNFTSMRQTTNTFTLTLTTTIAVPPVVPTGVLRCRAIYVTAPASVTDATFAE